MGWLGCWFSSLFRVPSPQISALPFLVCYVFRCLTGMLYSFITIFPSFCGQYISNLPSICHHSICTNNNLQQTTITQKTLLSSQHACDKIKAYGQMEFHTSRGQTGFCSMKQEHLHCNSVQYYLFKKSKFSWILFVFNLVTGYFTKNGENYPLKYFWKKKPALKSNHGLAVIGLRATGPWVKRGQVEESYSLGKVCSLATTCLG